MITLFVIVVILACVILGLIVLIQNPKGGGLAGNIAGFSSQFMGVKQTTDVLEKGTWLFAAIIGVLCLVSSIFIRGGSSSGVDTNLIKQAGSGGPAAPANSAVPFNNPQQSTAPASTPADTTRK